MPHYTIMPMVNATDENQVKDTPDAARVLAEAFIAKYGAEAGCMAIVEFNIIGQVEYARPIFTTHVPNIFGTS